MSNDTRTVEEIIQEMNRRVDKFRDLSKQPLTVDEVMQRVDDAIRENSK